MVFRVLVCVVLAASSASASDYSALKRDLADQRRAWLRAPGSTADLRNKLLTSFDKVSSRWLGTRWGLGVPQTRVPQQGKVNCGTFVGQVLADMGFRIRVWKWQQQPSHLMITGSTPKGTRWRRWFSRTSMERFARRMRAMGDGLYLIGLDFHVGFLRQRGNQLRFIHASYVTGRVVNEPALTAQPIVTSRAISVGKLLSRKMLNQWVRGRRLRSLPWHRSRNLRRGKKRGVHLGTAASCRRCAASR